jgi:2-C-methyl-D-erythritol 4-phosphate cytidylyltransferase
MAHSIAAVQQHPLVASVTVAISADDGLYAELVRPLFPGLPTVTGGDCRARTVHNGLQFIAARESGANSRADPESDWVLVHDAARPCLEQAALERLIEKVQQDQAAGHRCGAILAMPVSDTLKLADPQGNISRTVDRQGMWSAQTPQLFPLQQLLQSLSAALTFGTPPTDEAQAMERSGHPVVLVAGSADNIKITRPEDLAIAEAILSRHQAAVAG